MSKLYLYILLIGSSNISFAQVISQFTWDNNPVTQADIGPNATSVSGSAYSSSGGVGGTNGLNPKLSSEPKRDIELDIPASPTFDVPGIDISIDFMRNESVGDFVNRGNDWRFGMNGGNLYVNFRLEDGSGGYTTINSGNVYSIPSDDNFRTYRFFYNPDTGVAEIRVNGTTEWTFTGTPGVNMYYSATTLRVGDRMDGTGTNEAIFDNLIIAEVFNSPLPVELSTFSCTPVMKHVDLNWTTLSENKNDYFEIHRSSNGIDFNKIGEVKGVGNSTSEQNYEFTDNRPLGGISYYRLKQVDFDGKYEFSDIRSVKFDASINAGKVYPNPAINKVKLEEIDDFVIYDVSGKIIEDYEVTSKSQNSMELNISNLNKGLYFIKTLDNTYKLIKK